MAALRLVCCATPVSSRTRWPALAHISHAEVHLSRTASPCRTGVSSREAATCSISEDSFGREMQKVQVAAAGALMGIAIGACSIPAPPALADFLSYDHADMRGADLSKQNLRGAVFAACDCRRINLQDSNLDGTTDTFAGFQGANLNNTSWVRALADRVVFRGADLRNANFTNAILSGSQFDDADVTGADFTEAILDNSQRLKMCRRAKGVNSVTGVETRESLYC